MRVRPLRSINRVSRGFHPAQIPCLGEAAGRGESVRAIRRYGRLCLQAAILTLLEQGRAKEARVQLWRYRRYLVGPLLPILAVTTCLPRRLVAALRRLRRWMAPLFGARWEPVG